MSFAEIETELDHLSPEELRRLALKSWRTFVAKEAGADGVNECDEGHPGLLAALDEALAHADARPRTCGSTGSRPVKRMDFQVIFKDTFLADLERIVRLIAVHNPAAACKFGSAP
jgi:hypothetical protein